MADDMLPPFWARPRFVLSAILAYLAAHFAIRLAMGPGLGVDDAEQALFAQHYAWAYRYRAPPLFTWWLTTLSQVMPVGALALALLRYTLLGILYGFIYLTARRLLTDARLAALSVYSFAAIGTFAEGVHQNLTHSTTLAALIAITWYIFVRLAANPALKWYLALGVAFGLGVLAKWNFVIFAAALPLACLLRGNSRGLVWTWKTIAAGMIAALIVLPTFVATLQMGPPPGEDVQSVFDAAAGPGLAAIAEGTLKLVETTITYALPLLPIVLIVFAAPLWRSLHGYWAAAPTQSDSATTSAAIYRPDAMLVGATIAIGLALLWGFVLVLGATEFKVRYVYPVLLILPVWLVMVIAPGRPSHRAVSLFAIILAAATLFVIGKRVGTITGAVDCDLCMEMQPYPELAAQLRQAGYNGGGTILATDTIAGNLRGVFPQARIIDPNYRRTRWPPAAGPESVEQAACLFVWQANPESPAAPPEGFTSYLADRLAGAPDAAHESGIVSAARLPPADGTLHLRYRHYAEPNGDCR